MEKLFLADSKKTLTSLIKIRDITIDNSVFRLHYRATSLILIVFSILVTATQFFGDPIRCIQNDDIGEKIINTYCWIEGTYTLPKAFNKKVGIVVPYPGVDKTEDEDEIKEHAYYQWVCFVLFLQAIIFYLPRLMWKNWEGRRIKGLVVDLHDPIVKEDRDKKLTTTAEYFAELKGHNKTYALGFVLCELFNLINTIAQIYIIDVFLGGEFTTFGSDVIRFSRMEQEERLDPMIRVFPRMTKCTFHRYGSSGDVQKHDAFCLLPLNIVNEKIYIIIWFWLVILAILSGLAFVYRLVLIVSPRVRSMMFDYTKIGKFDDMDYAIRRIGYSDWFVLRLLHKNIERGHYTVFFQLLVKELKKKDHAESNSEKRPFIDYVDSRDGKDDTLRAGANVTKEKQKEPPIVKV